MLVILPSRDLSEIARHHVGSLPRALRMLLRTMGALNTGGGQLMSYLLFQDTLHARAHRARLPGRDEALGRSARVHRRHSVRIDGCDRHAAATVVDETEGSSRLELSR